MTCLFLLSILDILELQLFTVSSILQGFLIWELVLLKNLNWELGFQSRIQISDTFSLTLMFLTENSQQPKVELKNMSDVQSQYNYVNIEQSK